MCAASLSRMYATFNAGISCQTSKNTIREFPLVIATVAKVSRKRGLWLVVRVKKGDTRRYLHFYSFSSAASYVGMIQIRYTGLGDAANSQPDPSGSPVCLFSFFSQDLLYTFRTEKSSLHPVSYMISRLRTLHGSIDIFHVFRAACLQPCVPRPSLFPGGPFRNFLSCQ